ncbi:hypothetical protein OIU34_16670 [Pararhizobium sp. BT-229]|uniref:hypothetical protein n=1 Tax=Pararhizobium sp. BT-229 TaxID=2986923 RepID=UPI0021F6A568|nr:hypothetical protein [Pararhizobium sp. BT-229]MCV9963538.1 hypothetical protein [Pararhizobium sp. BT-229]
MTGYRHPTDVIVSELREMRELVAAAARAEADSVSYRAYLLQARSLRSIEEQVAAQNAAAMTRAIREDVLTDESQVERYWFSMLADWLEHHAQLTLDSLEGGNTDRLPFAVDSEDERKIARLHAKRHHEMIADFCERHTAVLRSRTEELERDIMAFGEVKASSRPSPGF